MSLPINVPNNIKERTISEEFMSLSDNSKEVILGFTCGQKPTTKYTEQYNSPRRRVDSIEFSPVSTTSTEGNFFILCVISQTLAATPCVNIKVELAIILFLRSSKDTLLVSIVFSSSIVFVITKVSSSDKNVVGGYEYIIGMCLFIYERSTTLYSILSVIDESP